MNETSWPARLTPRGPDAVLECIVAVGQIRAGDLHGDAVELDVRTLRNVLIERRLVEGSIGTGMNAGGCTRSVAHGCAVDLGLAAVDLGLHVEAGTGIAP